MKPMRNLLEALVILGTVALATFAGFGLALASAELNGGLDGWDGVIAVVAAGFVAFLALVSSTLATLVVRRRGWRIAYLVVTVLGAVYVALGALGAGRGSDSALGDTAIATALALALWLPVGTRWWIESRRSEQDEPREDVSRRAALIAGIVCAVVVLLAVGLTLALAGPQLPAGLAGFALVLVVTAAVTSGRVPDTMALALLAGVGVCAVLFSLPEAPSGGLVTAALAVAVLVAFSWRPFAARITAARRATVVLPPD